MFLERTVAHLLQERWMAAAIVAAWLGCAACAGCGGTPTVPAGKPDETPAASNGKTPEIKSPAIESPAVPPAGTFREVTAELGLPQPRFDWPNGRYHTPEITPGGVALFDYNNDGRLDIYQVCHAPPGEWPAAFDVPAPNRLFRQLENGRFEEVAQAAGLADPGFGHGVAVGDVNNDGFVDVYVTNFGRNRFYRNNGEGAFSDQTREAGLEYEPGWSSSACFVDYDRDGWLDLFVTRFGRFDPDLDCRENDGSPTYCGPHRFQGIRDLLYHNRGDGTFENVTEASGIDQPPGRGWGVLCFDANADGWPDIYVANDEEPAQLWINQRNGKFVDEAILRNCALSGLGNSEAGMGVCVGDVDGNGRWDLFKTHIAGEKNTLYLADADGNFADASARSNLAVPSLPMTGWGCGFLDVDCDGDLDLAVANGRVTKLASHSAAKLGEFWNHYAEPNQFFENDGRGKFAETSLTCGDFALPVESTRGLALGDLDNDGDLDLATNAIGNVLHVYRNDRARGENHQLTVRAMTRKRDALGAVITVRAGEKTFTRIADPGYSYCSSNDARAHFGLGPVSTVDAIEIAWPNGQREQFPSGPVDCQHTLQQGEGMQLR